MPRVAHDAEDQRVGEAAVAIVEFGERLRVAPLQARDQIAYRPRRREWRAMMGSSIIRISARLRDASNCIYERRARSRFRGAREFLRRE